MAAGDSLDHSGFFKFEQNPSFETKTDELQDYMCHTNLFGFLKPDLPPRGSVEKGKTFV